MKSVDVKDLGKIAVVMGGSSGEREVSLIEWCQALALSMMVRYSIGRAAFIRLAAHIWKNACSDSPGGTSKRHRH
ncbi:hypothetical protein [Parasutterella sp.]|uniref:hypothetical protein n=1 Tax=Parasutterella sp. TaxID=2049037 RepID=UPI00399F610D